MPVRLALSLLVLGVAAGTAAQPSGSFVIRDVRVFDGVRVGGPATVVVRDGKIASIAGSSDAPHGLPVIDGAGKTLLPGLIDSHTHSFGNALRQALESGVTTELDMFTDWRYARQVKSEQAEGKDTDLADLRSAGTLATAPKGHGTEYGLNIPTIAGPAEAQAFVDARIAEGSDYIKIIYTVPLAIPTVSKETLAALIQAAHKRGKMAVVHINSRQGAMDAIECGADGLAHLFTDQPPGAGFGQFVAAHHAFVITTLTVLERSSTYANAEEALRQLKAAGVPILAGTDVPNVGAHGVAMHHELELLVRAGLTPVEALRAATSTPAAVFHLDDRGVIRAGARADLLLVTGDPTAAIAATQKIAGVWKAGVALASTETAPPLAAGELSDFEDGTTKAAFGFGWQATADKMAGGKSEAEIKVVPGGANGSKSSLLVEGEVRPGFVFPFAGAAFYPAAKPMQPANLSGAKSIRFRAKGDGQTYRVMVYTRAGGYMPGMQTFAAGPEWAEYTFPLTAFNGTDGHDITAISFAAGPEPRKFSFQIDDVGLR
ncbi:MAG TPA: CIA30 family protein [Bryobacteraceae bacterium]|nr:CIA30 family protein [Bryobacteraceae bacterium]